MLQQVRLRCIHNVARGIDGYAIIVGGEIRQVLDSDNAPRMCREVKWFVSRVSEDLQGEVRAGIFRIDQQVSARTGTVCKVILSDLHIRRCAIGDIDTHIKLVGADLVIGDEKVMLCSLVHRGNQTVSKDVGVGVV